MATIIFMIINSHQHTRPFYRTLTCLPYELANNSPAHDSTSTNPASGLFDDLLAWSDTLQTLQTVR